MQTTISRKGESVSSFRNYTLTFLLTTTCLFFVQNPAFSSEITVEPGSSEPEKVENENALRTYRLFLGRFENEVPIETVELFASLGDVKSIKSFDGSYSFYSKPFASESEVMHGAETLIMVIELNGELYCPSQYKKMKKF
jgi:hypothetical protein